MRYELSDKEWTIIAANYLAFVQLASTRLWLRVL
jgi:transposase